MFSDTHFHFLMTTDSDTKKAAKLLNDIAAENAFFALDIGTKPDDLLVRQKFAKDVFEKMSLLNFDTEKAKKFLFFSAGIWPDAEVIKNRAAALKALRAAIENASIEKAAEENAAAQKTAVHTQIVAIGECGLDHHWNKSGADLRDENDFSDDILTGEAEMFEAQLEMARELKLPVIVHSRDAFDGTYSCIKNVGYDCGIIHCFSYGAKEAAAFIERGWHVSFSGSVTYAKKSQIEKIRDTILSVPDDKLLIETDAPYLSPVPLRGTKNTPLNICHTYKFVAEIRGMSVESLCALVDENCKKLFDTH